MTVYSYQYGGSSLSDPSVSIRYNTDVIQGECLYPTEDMRIEPNTEGPAV